jgi:inositol-phosphate phosphatase/L-galactose 1-phosphate phosphatase/histidinol-phosphatase
MIIQEMLKVAETLADIAGEIARRYFRNNVITSLKDNKSPVTIADLEIETALREYLTRHFSEHGILGEEYGLQTAQSEFLWVLDPIDGTTSFICGKPTFCTLIGLLKNEKPLLGIIDQPIIQDRWVGAVATSTTWNKVACFTHPGNSTLRLSCTSQEMLVTEQQIKKFAVVRKLAAVVSYGGDAYAYGLLAAGYIDIIMESDLKFYDVAAIIPIIEGAGGCITNWQGESLTMDNFDGTAIAVSSKELHAKVLAAINEV